MAETGTVKKASKFSGGGQRHMADLSTESGRSAFEDVAGQAMLAEGHGIVKIAES
jgi:hypothetical protein